MEKKLRNFLEKYIGQGTQKNDTVTQEAVDLLVLTARGAPRGSILGFSQLYQTGFGRNHPRGAFG